MTAPRDPRERRVLDALTARRAAWARAADCAAAVSALAVACIESLRSGGQVIFFGNGGSAAQADHLAAEMLGRYLIDDRPPLAARALSQTGAVLTALGNDHGYRSVFSRQIEAVARPGDLLIGLSTSGRSPNIREALESGRRMSCVLALLTGEHAREDLPEVDHLVRAPSRETPVIQEMHLVFGHLLCELVEAAFDSGCR
jgi:D-sedoheptulose 7-phosphate isomerase